MNWRIFSALILGITLCVPLVHAQESYDDLKVDIDPQVGFDRLQEPFTKFLNDASRIDISQSSSSQFDIPNPEAAKDYWDNANAWLKERTGLDILSLLKVIGNIIVFIMNLAINAMGVVIKIIQWLLSLIPTNQ